MPAWQASRSPGWPCRMATMGTPGVGRPPPGPGGRARSLVSGRLRCTAPAPPSGSRCEHPAQQADRAPRRSTMRGPAGQQFGARAQAEQRHPACGSRRRAAEAPANGCGNPKMVSDLRRTVAERRLRVQGLLAGEHLDMRAALPSESLRAAWRQRWAGPRARRPRSRRGFVGEDVEVGARRCCPGAAGSSTTSPRDTPPPRPRQAVQRGGQQPARRPPAGRPAPASPRAACRHIGEGDGSPPRRRACWRTTTPTSRTGAVPRRSAGRLQPTMACSGRGGEGAQRCSPA